MYKLELVATEGLINIHDAHPRYRYLVQLLPVNLTSGATMIWSWSGLENIVQTLGLRSTILSLLKILIASMVAACWQYS